MRPRWPTTAARSWSTSGRAGASSASQSTGASWTPSALRGLVRHHRRSDARRFLLRYGDGGWPNLLDPYGTVAIDYGVSGVPESFFIDAEGMVRFKQWAAVTEEEIVTQLPPLLDEAATGTPPD